MGAWGGILLGLFLIQDAELERRIDALVARHGLKPERTSILVGGVRAGHDLYSRGADRRLIPASNAKIVTSAWALHTYGETALFRTRLYVDGSIRDGRLQGNLVVRAGGDPNISGRFFDSPTFLFERWRDALGIRGISGSLVLVDDRFEREEFHPDWSEKDLSKWYAAPVRGFALNDNCIDIAVSPGADTGRVTLTPDTRYVTIDNGTRTVKNPKRPVAYWRRPGTNTIVLRGELAPGASPVKFSCTVENPTGYFGTVLLETLGLRARIVEADRLPDSLVEAKPFAVHEFDLKRTLKVCNRRSQNLYAEMLFKSVGGGSWESGTRGVAGFMKSLGRDGVLMRDGSGLSRKSRLSAGDLVAVLRAMHIHPARAVFRDSLAVPGDPEGTLRRRLKDLKGRLFAKTGHLSGVSSLSGYVVSKNGTEFVFSVIVNGGGGDALQNDLCRLLASIGAD